MGSRMITGSPQPRHIPRWQRELASSLRCPRQLLRRLRLEDDPLYQRVDGGADFPVLVTEAFCSRMREGDPEDPLLAQVLALQEERFGATGFGADPVGDLDASAGEGVLRKYRGRALLIATGACAVHCRYCFRRHFPYGTEHAGRDDWRNAAAAVAADPSIEEVVLSGGDPLMLADARLSRLTDRLAGIANLKRLRIHTRMPVVLPSRVDDGLLAWIRGCSLPVIVVIHANHHREIDQAVLAALRALRGAGAQLLNQSVLLRGVNDSADVLARLSERLLDGGVLPYYLHALDPVHGAAHFEVPDDEARRLVAQLRRDLPGYLVPRLVREIAGEPCKQPLT